MSNTVVMHMNYEVTKCSDRFEAECKLHWYAGTGRYNIACVGQGATIEAAKKNASLMLGQARAALTVALIETVPSRVPETANATGRHDDRTPQPLG